MAAEDWNMFDEVKRPFHYEGNGKVTCKDAMDSMTHNTELPANIGYWWCCALKYLWRWFWKNGVNDLLKAKQCIDYLIIEFDKWNISVKEDND